MKLHGIRALSLFALVQLAFGCSSDPTPSGDKAVHSLFAVRATLDELTGETFYDHPWPSDLRRDADGSVHFAGLYNPTQTVIVEDYLKTAKGLLKGFSPAAAAYLRFDGDLDPASLPADPPASIDPKSSVQLVDVDPASPERGKRKLVQLSWRKEPGVYILADTLAVMPALGYPLRPKTKYALVVTRAAHALGGASIEPSADLEEVIGTKPVQPRTQAAHDLFAPAVQELAAAGVAAKDIAHLTVYTTNDPTEELFAVADDVRASVPAPTVAAGSWQQKEQAPSYDVYEGTYGPSPNYQQGNVPFRTPADGGGFAFEGGKPKLAGTFDLRFALAVPNAQACPAPTAGYPIVLYAHGTGGDYRSFVDDGTAAALAQKCVASIGIDQIFHGTRPGAPPDSDPNKEGNIQLLFFNLNNLAAARTNTRQAAIDVIQQARLFTETNVKVPANVSRTAAEIGFDSTKVIFFGHSQGGLNGPLYLAADPSARGGVLSGSGSLITIALLEKTSPQPSVAGAVKTVLQLFDPEQQAELTLFHPILGFVQTIIDSTDPVHYMRYVIQSPRKSGAPKSIYMTEGIAADGKGDSYAPPHGIEVGAVALGLPRMAPGVRPVTEMLWGGLGDVAVPSSGLTGNLSGGRASGVLAQWTPTRGDGHFVVFNVPQARAQAAGFCKNLADDPAGRVPAP